MGQARREPRSELVTPELCTAAGIISELLLPPSFVMKSSGSALWSRLASKPLPPDLLEQIIAKTDGVPLFVEELTKSILESGELRDDGDRWDYAARRQALAILLTLRDSLMARLDRYAPIKEVAQIGAAIGGSLHPGRLGRGA